MWKLKCCQGAIPDESIKYSGVEKMLLPEYQSNDIEKPSCFIPDMFN